MARDYGQIHTLADARTFYQPGGARPFNKVYLAASEDSSPIDITGVTDPQAARSFVKVHNPYRRGQYTNVAETLEAPGDPSGTVVFHYKKGGIPKTLLKRNCTHTFYVARGTCGDIASGLDFAWDSNVEVLAGGVINGDIDKGDLSTKDGSDPAMFSTPMRFRELYTLSKINFGLRAGTEITTEVLDATYGCRVDCGDCGVDDDGYNLQYVLVRPVAAAKPGIVYTTDNWKTKTAVLITAAAADEVPSAIAVIGNYLVVVSPTALSATAGGYYYAQINQFGVPGTFNKVTTGFVATKEPKGIYQSGAQEFFLVGDAGYIYRVRDVLAGATVVHAADATVKDLTRIDGVGEVLYAGGIDGAVLYSYDKGTTWTLTPAAPVAATINVTAIAVRSRYRVIVGTSNGKMYVTEDGGNTWTERSFPDSGTGAVEDIKYVNDEVAYFSHTVGGAAKIWATICGFQTITNVAPRIQNLPATTRINRIAIPSCADTTIAANHLLLAGLGAASDGQLIQGVSTEV